MTRTKKPVCGEWFKLVEILALKNQGEYGEEVFQGDFFRFLGPSVADGYCECYSPRLNSRFWIKLEYLIPVSDLSTVFDLEMDVPEEFKQPSFQRFSDDFTCFAQLKTKES